MIGWRLGAYVALVTGLAGLTLVGLRWEALLALPQAHLLGLGALTLLALMSESLAISQVIGKTAGSSSVTFIIILACVLLFGPEATVLLVFTTGLVFEFAFRKKEWYRAVFNVSQYLLSVALAGAAFQALGGAPSPDSFSIPWIAFFTFGVTLILTNQGTVSVFLALREGLPFRRVFTQVSGGLGLSVLYDLLASPIAIGVVFFYAHYRIWGLLAVLFPLFFVRRAYLINQQLQEANKNLLRVLIKAIETRDPYTSGHSLRVSALARRIAEGLGVSVREANGIETAALLHDIGKIEAVYAEILMKPEALTPSERAIIESHVEKGVDLLESLTSFKNDVIDAVRHHHERYDGTGYPARLAGKAIPLGSRIIMICDAIDAMLSDRPYRRALRVHEVRNELEVHSATQFDPEIVQRILEGEILETHAREVRRFQISDREETSLERKVVALG
jgi:putative nucleotidyltransferase with HDIG domain